ncbi:uncharacterized protein V1510DRAFT_422997 [Dipodascopsis tothii]|uniref:uncharacterized protein n=1 Tax=Dipodascopsis tothii TaxID=44089 RepID=UPI0034CD84AB
MRYTSASKSRKSSSAETKKTPRSRNGCWTCRNRKIKCDEVHPKCTPCSRLRISCDYTRRLNYKDDTPRILSKMAAMTSTKGCPVYDRTARPVSRAFPSGIWGERVGQAEFVVLCVDDYADCKFDSEEDDNEGSLDETSPRAEPAQDLSFAALPPAVPEHAALSESDVFARQNNMAWNNAAYYSHQPSISSGSDFWSPPVSDSEDGQSPAAALRRGSASTSNSSLDSLGALDLEPPLLLSGFDTGEIAWNPAVLYADQPKKAPQFDYNFDPTEANFNYNGLYAPAFAEEVIF